MSGRGGARIAILGVGYAVPDAVRRNDDPVFDELLRDTPPGSELFGGYRERRVLSPGETVEDLLQTALERALEDADLEASSVGMLLGYISVSDYRTPNGLSDAHRRLKLPQAAPVLPINNEFNNFTTSLTIARALMAAGGSGPALIACAGNWTQHVDYATPQSYSAADGAGCAVIGLTDEASRFGIVDSETLVWADNFGAMYMAGDVVATVPDCGTHVRDCTYTTPYFHIPKAGMDEYRKFGIEAPPLAVNRLLERNRLKGPDIALITHQSSSVLLESWNDAIRPCQFLDTLARFGNMTVANLPVNLACGYGDIHTDHLVICGIGVEGQVHAVLLSRE